MVHLLKLAGERLRAASIYRRHDPILVSHISKASSLSACRNLLTAACTAQSKLQRISSLESEVSDTIKAVQDSVQQGQEISAQQQIKKADAAGRHRTLLALTVLSVCCTRCATVLDTQPAPGAFSAFCLVAAN